MPLLETNYCQQQLRVCKHENNTANWIYRRRGNTFCDILLVLDRSSQWMTMAVDRCRFDRRLDEMSTLLYKIV